MADNGLLLSEGPGLVADGMVPMDGAGVVPFDGHDMSNFCMPQQMYFDHQGQMLGSATSAGDTGDGMMQGGGQMMVFCVPMHAPQRADGPPVGIADFGAEGPPVSPQGQDIDCMSAPMQGMAVPQGGVWGDAISQPGMFMMPPQDRFDELQSMQHMSTQEESHPNPQDGMDTYFPSPVEPPHCHMQNSWGSPWAAGPGQLSIKPPMVDNPTAGEASGVAVLIDGKDTGMNGSGGRDVASYLSEKKPGVAFTDNIPAKL